ncbi:uncharacterized protein LOC127281394 isoform X2 [Leptopilina boulardi]|uniref:uncharacterized protein LOC127281394 isoform X2 n=1 Tax=Leptopilina boulardi TaxID=63433 RepID=UPI0021F54340|nr:uncharacterized protein LOC127281394 isoform X2 [Leptopilina boulardi]
MTNLFLINWNLLLIILVIEIKYLHCILPPSYVVDLRDKEIFEISSDDNYDENENEMLKIEDLDEIKSFADDEEKYQPLHYHVKNENRQFDALKKIVKFSRNSHFHPIIVERNIINDEAKPFIAGFKETLDKIKYKAPEILLKKKKQLSLKNAIFGGRKKFLSTRKNNNEGFFSRFK